MLLANKSWETRTAAAGCLGHLADHFVHHTESTLRAARARDPPHLDAQPDPPPLAVPLLSIAEFNAASALQHGTPLAAAPDDVRDMRLHHGVPCCPCCTGGHGLVMDHHARRLCGEAATATWHGGGQTRGGQTATCGDVARGGRLG